MNPNGEVAKAVAIRTAAKAQGVSYGRVLALIDAGKLRAFKASGDPVDPKALPSLKVYVHELAAALEEDRLYVLPSLKGRLQNGTKKRPTKIHPAVMLMRHVSRALHPAAKPI